MLETFLNMSLAVERVKERSNISTPLQDAYIEELLNLSAGRTGEHSQVFRPYYVAAFILEQDVSRQQLTKAGDVQFTQFVTVIQSLRSLQSSFDVAYSLILPPGMAILSLDVNTHSSPSATTTLRNSVVF